MRLSKLERTAQHARFIQGNAGNFSIESDHFNHYTQNFEAASALLKLKTGYSGKITPGMDATQPFNSIKVGYIPAHGSSVRGVKIEYSLSEEKTCEKREVKPVSGPAPRLVVYDGW